jgi:hypothetical protein
MAERKLPIGVQDFEKIIAEGYNYVDKTQYIVQLLKGSVYFLNRPRRFGKSLFLSTLAAYFRGQKELFKGLYLEKVEEELARQGKREAWIEYPVLYLDFNTENYKKLEDLENILHTHLKAWETLYGKDEAERTLSSRFKGVIQRAYEKTSKKVVVLIDEYDKALLDTLDNEDLNIQYRDILGAFFSVIKTCDEYLRFSFLTGVSKFSEVSVFSGLNNLRDISQLPDFAAICGITETELNANFVPEMKALADKLKLPINETLETLRKRYDGYLFAQEGENVYNPFSLLNTFASRVLKDYWYATGTPDFLVKYLKEAHYFIPDLEGGVRLDDYGLDKHRADAHDPIPILFQTGYLTIKEYIAGRNYYRLGYPNDEVRYGFLNNLKSSFLPLDRGLGISIFKFLDDVDAQDVDAFMERLQTVFANLPYDTTAREEIKFRERDYQIVVYLIFALLGQYTETEVVGTTGRADCVVITATTVYLFELKLWSAGTAEEALQQIIEKDYAAKYASSGKEIILIGASFDEEKRNIKEWVIQRKECR